MSAPVDLRSDTVTRPTPAMRVAIAEAAVGDDVYGEDPTVRALEEDVAELLGFAAALWVPTGTMANQVALAALTRPGDSVIVGGDAHCWLNESGALAALAGVQVDPIAGSGRFTAVEVRARFRADHPYTSPTRVVAVENTHNAGGGRCWSATALAEVIATARELGMALHLDGARIWNAAIAGNTTPRALAAGFDTVSVCLSKGLGAPAGSVVAGSVELVRACHRLRKRYGGGLRQAGILAAAGRHALAHHQARIVDDHRRARRLAERLATVRGATVDVTAVETNIVMIDLDGDPAPVVAAAAAQGVKVGVFGPRRLRAVTHLDIDDAGVDRAGEVLAQAIEAM